MVTDKFQVNGVLQKTYVPQTGGTKYSVKKGYKYFNTLDEASKYADKVMDLTGTVLRVK